MGKWTYAQKSHYNEFVESELENWVLMNQTTSKVDSNDKKMKIDGFILNKVVIGTVRRDQFLYTSLKFDYKFNSWLLQYFSLNFLIPPSLGSSFCFIPSFFFPLYHPHVEQIASIDPCPIKTFLKSLVIAIRQKITVQVSPPH